MPPTIAAGLAPCLLSAAATANGADATDLGTLLARLGIAFALGVGVAVLRGALRHAPVRDGLAWVLAVLAPLICLVVRAISDDLAKAFGLVGILALVRFRTPMRDASDAVFVLMSVAVGVVVASKHDVLVAACGVGAVGACAVVARLLVDRRRGPRAGGDPTEVRVRCRPDALPRVEAALAEATGGSVHLRRVDLRTAPAACEARFSAVPRPGCSVADLVRIVAAVEGADEVVARAAGE